ncbi:MAG TPA: hypothetical protein VKH20_04990 [Solirubrobacterales bacterium]|nr:hypothetical protein [Solirubrobacterales bacterium]
MKPTLLAASFLAVVTALGALSAAAQSPGPCSSGGGGTCPAGEPLPSGSFQATPLTDFVPGQIYLGLSGGLYGNNSNTVPTRHDRDGKNFAASIHPINGKIILLSIGMSNTTIEFCGSSTFNYGKPNQPCATTCPNPNFNQPQSFMAQAQGSGVLNPSLVIWDGALGGQTYPDWDPFVPGVKCSNDPTNPWCNYDRVKSDLNAAGYDESQVQAIWLKGADGYPQCSLNRIYCVPGYTGAEDAILAEQYMGDTLRAVHQRYVNAKLVFVSSRIYGGYANKCLNPEPFAYEYGFSVQKLVVAQINQINTGHVDGNAGNLNYDASNPPVTAPWVAWGPYLWASGTNANSQGLFWCNGQSGSPCNGEQDFRAGIPADPGDFTHPSSTAEQKVGTILLNFMETSPYTKGWFCLNGNCA